MTYIYDYGKVTRVNRKANIWHFVSGYDMLNMAKNNDACYAEAEIKDAQLIESLKKYITKKGESNG